MKGILITNTKGGVGKTTLCHLFALGAAWRRVPAHVMHTDNRPPMKVKGRPYIYYDARDPNELGTLMKTALNNNGFCIIDSGGNRPDFDKWMVKYVDLTIIPVTPDPEAVAMAIEQMKTLEDYGATDIRFILNMVPSNRFERQRDFKQYFSKLPKNKIMGQLAKVSAVKGLREDDIEPFSTPSTRVNSLSKNLYSAVQDILEQKNKSDAKNLQPV